MLLFMSQNLIVSFSFNNSLSVCASNASHLFLDQFYLFAYYLIFTLFLLVFYLFFTPSSFYIPDLQVPSLCPSTLHFSLSQSSPFLELSAFLVAMAMYKVKKAFATFSNEDL